MKRLRLFLTTLVLAISTLPTPVSALDTPATPYPIISEIKVKNDTLGFDEFIEIYNPTTETILLNDFNLEYFNTLTLIVIPPALPPTPKQAMLGDGLLPAGQRYVLAKQPAQIPHAVQSPFDSLVDGGGIVRITDLTGTVLDEVSWASTVAKAIPPIVLANDGKKSLQRNTDTNNQPIVTPVAWLSLSPSPLGVDLVPLPPPPPVEEPVPDPEPTPEPAQEPAPDPTTPDPLPITDPQAGTEQLPLETSDPTLPPISTANLLPLQITELLPNPAAPAIDTTDEFVELYNPSSEPLDLAGYKLQTGNTYSYNVTFTNQTIAPNDYLLITSGTTSLSLANTIGRARLLDPFGAVISETNVYEDAPDGQSWAYYAGTWQWTTSPTPLAANTVTLLTPVVKVASVLAAKTAAAKKTAAKTTATPKAKATTTKVATTAKSTKKAADAAASSGGDFVPEDTPPAIHPVILAGIGGSALLYAAYEYRYDVANRIYSFRSNRAARRAARAAIAGR